MRQRKVRHPWRGIISGLILGVGLGLMSIVYGVNVLGDLTPWVGLLIGLAIGIALVFVPRPWGRSSAPAAVTGPAQGRTGP